MLSSRRFLLLLEILDIFVCIELALQAIDNHERARSKFIRGEREKKMESDDSEDIDHHDLSVDLMIDQ